MTPQESTLADYKVLLIEDDRIDQENITRILTLAKEDFEVTIRESLQDGVYALRQSHYDAIMLDLGLPDSYGVDTINRLLEEFKNVPILVLSGTDDKQVAKEARDLGIENYLVKGETPGDVLSQTLVFAIELYRSSQKLISAAAAAQ